MNELKIKVPQGMVIDTEKSNLAEGIIKFKPIKKQLPKTWEEFCDTCPITEGEYYIDSWSRIQQLWGGERDDETTNALPNKRTAEAMLALCQLIQLRDCYNGDWKPNWCEASSKYIIDVFENRISTNSLYFAQKVLSFKTAELRDQFLENFNELIEVAKPLI